MPGWEVPSNDPFVQLERRSQVSGVAGSVARNGFPRSAWQLAPATGCVRELDASPENSTHLTDSYMLGAPNPPNERGDATGSGLPRTIGGRSVRLRETRLLGDELPARRCYSIARKSGG